MPVIRIHCCVCPCFCEVNTDDCSCGRCIAQEAAHHAPTAWPNDIAVRLDKLENATAVRLDQLEKVIALRLDKLEKKAEDAEEAQEWNKKFEVCNQEKEAEVEFLRRNASLNF